MRFTPDFPLVAKIGSAEAGYGKMRFQTSDDFGDFRGYTTRHDQRHDTLLTHGLALWFATRVVALHKDYVTLERLIEDREYDIRVQKVGTHLRAYKRMNSNWKGNVGTCVLEEIEVTDTFREWAEECGKLFGGMDILTVVRAPSCACFVCVCGACDACAVVAQTWAGGCAGCDPQQGRQGLHSGDQ
jgi:hypothetical protein